MSDFIFLGSKITVDSDCSHGIKRHLFLGIATTNLEQRHHFADKGLYTQSYGFSRSHVWMWELDNKEGWSQKNRCFWTVVLKTLESPLDCKEIQPVHPKWNLSWIFIGRTDAEAEAPILWPPDSKNWLIGKDSDAGKDWGEEIKGVTENEGWLASSIQWTWVGANSGRWWMMGNSGLLQSIGGSQRDGLDWAHMYALHKK